MDEIFQAEGEAAPAAKAPLSDATVDEAEDEADADLSPAQAQQVSLDARVEAAKAEIREELSILPGYWYVLHTYSGYERRVKSNLEQRIQTFDMEDYIYQVEVPMEKVIQVKNTERKIVDQVRIPGYALVRMELVEEAPDAWRVVKDTPAVTGFVGDSQHPVPLTEDEIVSMLAPSAEAIQAADVAEGREKSRRDEPRARRSTSTSRSARTSPSPTARSRRCRRRSPRSNLNSKSSRSSSSSSTARPRWSCRSTRWQRFPSPRAG
ncbi:transcription termination/antitermination NusG family protein [Nanchangia anserum]|uniref:transcription termination/antitermination NusG family protein n=1 Tax=Nanchangia anserum TaxID=2692125 RepID=UPI001D12EF06|nr:transcription termination/antitermination NusG family protein [Nanchangia anserum]